MKTSWMIYGANGYTGDLIAREAQRRGLTPILAGRSRDKIEPLARSLGLESRVFQLDDNAGSVAALEDVRIVLHCAGPFSATSAPMMDACLAAHAHYLDITGEIGVFEHAQQQHAWARSAGIVICPGVGFDVIPTDCLAATLKTALPDATHLALGFDSRSGFSPGTAKTSIEGLADGGKVREDGEIVSVPLAFKTRRIDFGSGEKLAMTIPWGDVSTAYHSTGIPNVEVYIPGSPRLIANAKRINYIRWALGNRWVQNFLKNRIGQSVQGPDEVTRAKQPTYVWGEAKNSLGHTKIARIVTANGYSLTVSGALAVVEFLLKNEPEPGTYTPSKLMGADFITRLPGSGPITVT